MLNPSFQQQLGLWIRQSSNEIAKADVYPCIIIVLRFCRGWLHWHASSGCLGWRCFKDGWEWLAAFFWHRCAEAVLNFATPPLIFTPKPRQTASIVKNTNESSNICRSPKKYKHISIAHLQVTWWAPLVPLAPLKQAHKVVDAIELSPKSENKWWWLHNFMGHKGWSTAQSL